MTDTAASRRQELKRAYEAIFLAEFRNRIDRDERTARIVALRDSPAAKGLSFKERDAIATEAVVSVMDIEDEVCASASGGTWQ